MGLRNLGGSVGGGGYAAESSSQHLGLTQALTHPRDLGESAEQACMSKSKRVTACVSEVLSPPPAPFPSLFPTQTPSSSVTCCCPTHDLFWSSPRPSLYSFLCQSELPSMEAGRVGKLGKGSVWLSHFKREGKESSLSQMPLLPRVSSLLTAAIEKLLARGDP